jgi:hypothetical protein
MVKAWIEEELPVTFFRKENFNAQDANEFALKLLEGGETDVLLQTLNHQ